MMISHSKPSLGNREITALKKTLISGYVAQGKQVAQLESELSQQVGHQNGVAVSSGTSALHLALLSLGVTASDSVVLPTYACTAILNAVNMVGAKPVLADVDPESGNLTQETVAKKLQKNTRAVIAAHLFGQPAFVQEIEKLGVPVIEDCAQCIGAQVHGRPVGGLSTVSVFSFYATKLITGGEGGMVCTSDKKLAARLNDLRDYDEKDRYELRFNYKMSDIQATLARVQLKRLPEFIRKRRILAKKYYQLLKEFPIQLPPNIPETSPIYYRFICRVEGNVDKIIASMATDKIQCRKPIFKPLHQYFELGASEFKNAERLYQTSLSLPIYPDLPESGMRRVVSCLRRNIP